MKNKAFKVVVKECTNKYHSVVEFDFKYEIGVIARGNPIYSWSKFRYALKYWNCFPIFYYPEFMERMDLVIIEGTYKGIAKPSQDFIGKQTTTNFTPLKEIGSINWASYIKGSTIKRDMVVCKDFGYIPFTSEYIKNLYPLKVSK